MRLMLCSEDETLRTIIEEYSEQIEAIKLNRDYYIVTERDRRYNFVFAPDDVSPAGMNLNFIAFNMTLCSVYGLDKDEIASFLFHEIGHAVMKENDANIEMESLEKEKNADGLAIEIGLSDKLVSGLGKLINSAKFPEKVVEMRQRILACCAR